MKKSLFFGLVAILGLIGCSRNQEIDVPDANLSIFARTESPADTKTVVESGVHIYWEPGDEIAVFMGDESAKFTTDITDASGTATFKGTFGDQEWPKDLDLWAVYPFFEDATFDGETITTTLPSEQVAREGSFGKDMNLAIAHSNSSSLQFYNVGGGIRFSMTEEGIKKVMFEGLSGEIISGKVKIGFDENGKPEVQEVSGGSQFITLLPPAGKETFETGVWYYIVAIPGTLEGGYKLRFYKDTDYARKVSEKVVEIKRSVFGNVEKADMGIEYEAQTIPFPDNKEEWKASFELSETIAIAAKRVVDQYRSMYDENYADANLIVDEILRIDSVTSAQLEESGKQIFVQQCDGTSLHLVLEWDDEVDETDDPQAIAIDKGQLIPVPLNKVSRTNSSITPTGQKEALLLAPYYSGYKLKIIRDGKVKEKQKGKISINEKYMEYLLNAVGYRLRFLKDEEVHAEHFWGDSLAKYDIIMMLTHGGPDAVCVGHYDSNKDDFLSSVDESILEHLGRYAVEGTLEISVDKEWFDLTTTTDYPNSIVYIGACHSYDEGTSLHSYFHNHKAKAYSGFSGTVHFNSLTDVSQTRDILYSMTRSLCQGMNYRQAIDHLHIYDDIWTRDMNSFCKNNPYVFKNTYEENLFLVDPYPFDLKAIVNKNVVTLTWNNPTTLGSYQYSVNVDGQWYESQTSRGVTIPDMAPKEDYSWFVQADLYYDGQLIESYTTQGEPFSVLEPADEMVLLTRTYNGKTYSIIRKNTSDTDCRINGDGSKFYTCSYSVKVDGNTYDLPGSFYSYTDRDFRDTGPVMAVNEQTGEIHVFLIEKDTDETYGMCGYMFNIANGSISRQTVFTYSNFGWFPFFTWEEDQLALNCFSYSGYFAIIAFQNDNWTLYSAGDIYPDDFKAKQRGKELIFIY